ncbi:MAG: hypothetical protein F4X08_09040 [Gemmatimonadetes bacterium]|nr:hypothetical protein [Gemmatimonadota bacterium]MYD25943.1 hypothetical protein [Gemmatimonadota bacterium]MYI99189.1 hypothetical protein [Gemmatimonadota bacterium]
MYTSNRRSFALMVFGWLCVAGMPGSAALADQQEDALPDSLFLLPVLEAEAIVVTGTAVRESPIELP